MAATHYEQHPVDPELPLLLSAALVSLLRVHPALADHIGHLGYVPKLVAAVAYEGRRETMSSGEVKAEEIGSDGVNESDDPSSLPGQTPQERVRLSCLRVLHQLAASTACAEAMAATSAGNAQVLYSYYHMLLKIETSCWWYLVTCVMTLEFIKHQVVPLLMKAIGWLGGSILALETLKRVVVAGNRARDALVAQGLK